MKTVPLLALKLAGLAVVFLCWRAAEYSAFTFFWSTALVWGFVALVPLLAIAGRWLLDSHPTPERAAMLTIPVHYLEMILLGCAVIVAFRLTQAHPLARVAFPRSVSFPVMQILGALATLTVLNLALQGAGLPFATVLSKKLATNWLYARSRNPMLLSCLLFFIAGALWLQSLHAILWTTFWLVPAWVLYVRTYEERELELRFGEAYILYKRNTPFFLGSIRPTGKP